MLYLYVLRLASNKIGDEGMKSFSDALGRGALPQLKVLGLNRNKIGDAGLASFSGVLASGALPALRDVYLGGNPGDAGPVIKVLAERKK